MSGKLPEKMKWETEEDIQSCPSGFQAHTWSEVSEDTHQSNKEIHSEICQPTKRIFWAGDIS